ncbi:DUF2946 family protein [Niveibacterium sp.]|uniref:DUF2946 family protein n=1 Tax=Niveibacterium sp. TaxID=2017444 RepID=UPI0035B3D5E2
MAAGLSPSARALFLYRRLIVRFTLLAVLFALLAPALVHGVRIWQGAQLLDLCSARGAHQVLQFADGHVEKLPAGDHDGHCKLCQSAGQAPALHTQAAEPAWYRVALRAPAPTPRSLPPAPQGDALWTALRKHEPPHLS